MPTYFKLRDFEKRFDSMSIDELKQWKVYWTEHAQRMGSAKIQQLAMKRVHKIEGKIELKAKES